MQTHLAFNKLLMKKFILIGIILALQVQNLRGHNPQLATYWIRNYDAVWVIEARFAHAGLQAALEKYYEEVDFDNVSTDEYKKLIVKYVKSHIQMSTISENEISLGSGGIKLGGHQTDVRFVLGNLPEKPQDLLIKISCLKENANQQNLLKIPAIRPDEHFVLDQGNGCTFQLDEIQESKSEMSKNWLLTLLSMFLFGLLIFGLINSIKAFWLSRMSKS